MHLLFLYSFPLCLSQDIEYHYLCYTIEPCYLVIQCIIRKWKWSRSLVSDSLLPSGLYPAKLLCPWDTPGKNTGVDCHFLFQGIFPTQGSNPGLPHCRQTLYPLSHQGSFASTDSKLPIHPFPNPSPPWHSSVYSLCLWVCFYFIDKFICVILDSTYMWYPMVFVFLCLTSLSMIIPRFIHVAANGIIWFFFL